MLSPSVRQLDSIFSEKIVVVEQDQVHGVQSSQFDLTSEGENVGRNKNLRNTMSNQCRITATFRRNDGRTLQVRKATRAEPAQPPFNKLLDIDPALGGNRKIIA